MQMNLIHICENTKHKILFTESKQSDYFDGIITVTLKPKIQKSREHLILWGCYRMTMKTIPEVGFARVFDITGRSMLCLHFKNHVANNFDVFFSVHTKSKSLI